MLLHMSSPAFRFALLLPLAAALLHTAKLSAPHGVSIVNCVLHALLSADLEAPTRLSCCAPQADNRACTRLPKSRCHTEFAS